ncbi:MAG TPA: LLM class flavin-dependent oxidoreductase, partial [Roseiarcus sp.]|nr:LLM class flavin-dependent oxidoreductase [Roseiarcus sp.]
MAHRLRFGIFLAPFHKPGINPTLALQSDLELIQWLDRCGYDEAWFGEHHSAGIEISASPEIFMAVAAERTRHIKLGSGVVSLSYHNPLWVAERIVLLDHLTRGRVMLGVGPGSLPTDGAMIGVIMRLLMGNEPVNFKNERWELVDARLHLRPYSNPLFDMAVAAVASPTGPRLAARHGVGLLSVGATTAAGFDALALHWEVMEDQAKVHNTHVDRSKWRLVGLCHAAETIEQAYRDVEYGIEHWFQYFQAVAAFPQMAVPGNNVKEMISFINDSGFGAIGTPDMVTAQIDRLITQSDGGFGVYLMLAHNWADPSATLRSYELIARHVMPHFQGHAQQTLDAAARARRALRPRRSTAESGRSRDGGLRQGQGESSGLRRNRRQSSDRKVWKGRDCPESCVRGHTDADGGRIWQSRRTRWMVCWRDVTRRLFSPFDELKKALAERPERPPPLMMWTAPPRGHLSAERWSLERHQEGGRPCGNISELASTLPRIAFKSTRWRAKI